MQVLADTGCYADFTLPAAPLPPQVPKINAIYQCGRPLHERCPHWSGPDLRVHGGLPVLPVLFTGPLVFDWSQAGGGLPMPRIETGALTEKGLPSLRRLQNWQKAGVGVRGKPEWIFIKLHCHGFFMPDQPAMIGESMRRFLEEAMEWGYRSGEFDIHFATAREAFNIAMAAVDGATTNNPDAYRNYRLHQIMQAAPAFPGNAAVLETGMRSVDFPK